MSRSYYRLVRNSLANYGVLGTLTRVPRSLLSKLRNRHAAGQSRTQNANLPHPFDLAHHVDTSGLIWSEDLKTAHPNALWSTAYYGIAPSVFNQLMDELERRMAPDWRSFTFLDLGSGKGRALMLASRLPFRAIVGVEISEELVSVAQRNIATFHASWQQCFSLESREGDAASVDLPNTPLVIYLFHPFATPVLEAFLGNLERSLQEHPREVWILYFNPALEQVIGRHPVFKHEFSSTFTMLPEDAAADRFQTTGEAVAVYRYA